MKMKPAIRTATAIAVASSALLGYVANQWPTKVSEMPIPAGKVRMMPGGLGKGICVQGDPNGLSAWYRIKTK